MATFTVPARILEIEPLTDKINEILESYDCPMKVQMQIDVVLDEVLSNIANYAYDGDTGEMSVEVSELERGTGVKLVFTDKGRPYNPLEREDPDITLSAEERQIGGLGIFMVKKIMDTVLYENDGVHNILTTTKNF